MLELTLANGADLSCLDSHRGTGLIPAAERGHAAVVGRLLGAGSAVDHVNRPGSTARDEAIVYGQWAHQSGHCSRARHGAERAAGSGTSPGRCAVRSAERGPAGRNPIGLPGGDPARLPGTVGGA